MARPRVVLLIPARYASTRYPGKPLALLAGAGGARATLIERTWRAALAVRGVDAVYVATDDDRIAAAAEGFGATVVMASPEAANGTERCADALWRLGLTPEVVVNLQGDAPLTPPWFIEALIDAVDAGAAMATPVLRCTPEILARLRADRAQGKVGGTTAVFDAAGRALYFSKEVIPHGAAEVFHHVGVYAYTPAALSAYVAAPVAAAEVAEGLEQLRFLHIGIPVACVVVEARGREFWELNNPDDIPRIEAVLAAEGTP